MIKKKKERNRFFYLLPQNSDFARYNVTFVLNAQIGPTFNQSDSRILS